jgi:thiol-disulfide isomerase/thioredoxin
LNPPAPVPAAVLFPDRDAALLQMQLRNPSITLVACLCAAWCGTCRDYLPPFEALAAKRPDEVFAWIDIEDFPDLLDDHDVENFPTLLIQRGPDILFYGTMLPHIGHLERLLESFGADAEAIAVPAPDIRLALTA